MSDVVFQASPPIVLIQAASSVSVIQTNAQGPQGIQGQIGLTGPQGVAGVGVAGAQGLPGTQPWQTPPSVWHTATFYSALAPASTVTFGGGCYVCTTTHTSGGAFDATKWQIIAAAFNPTAGIASKWVWQINADGSVTQTQPQYSDVVDASPIDALAYNGIQINGSCDIDQEHAGALVPNATSGSAYMVDGWTVFKSGTMVVASQRVADAPPGLTNSVKITVTTAEASLGVGDYTAVFIPIEGYRIARLAFGTAAAQPVSIGFWTKHHRTGLYGGSIQNGVENRSYPFTYTHNVADTWQFNTVTIPGDQAGTWLSANALSMYLVLGIGVGTTFSGPAGAWAASNFLSANGAVNAVASLTDVFQATGLIVVPGIVLPSSARAALIMRPADQELLTCQRYYEKSFDLAIAPAQNASAGFGEFYWSAPATGAVPERLGSVLWKVRKRIASTLTLFNPVAANAQVRDGTANVDCSGSGATAIGESGMIVLTTGNAATNFGNRLMVHWTADSRM